MLQITRKHVFAAAHRLYDYEGQCERLHGHNYRVEVTLSAAALNRLGMVMDFAEVKEVLFGALDACWDHRTLLFERDPLCGSLGALLADGSICPVPFNPTAENMAAYLGENLFPEVMRRRGLDGVRLDAVTVHETDHSAARWSREA